MKKIKLLSIITSTILLVSCGSDSASGEGFAQIQADLASKFGKDAYYTEISITSNSSIGYITNAIVAENPESLKMEQWSQTQGSWTQTYDIEIEIPENTKASDFMFKLGDQVKLDKLYELVEQSKKKITEDKTIPNPTLHMAFIRYPDTGEVSKAQYVVIMQPENGGTSVTYSYSLDGSLIEGE